MSVSPYVCVNINIEHPHCIAYVAQKVSAGLDSYVPMGTITAPGFNIPGVVTEELEAGMA